MKLPGETEWSKAADLPLPEGTRVMLVLSRHRDESIMIGDDVCITVVEIRGDKVRLGIDASPNVPVHRQEVYDAIQRETRKAQKPESRIDTEPAPPTNLET